MVLGVPIFKHIREIVIPWFVCLYEAITNKFQIISSYRIDGSMTCDFTSFSTVFQSYQEDDNERLHNPIYG